MKDNIIKKTVLYILTIMLLLTSCMTTKYQVVEECNVKAKNEFFKNCAKEVLDTNRKLSKSELEYYKRLCSQSAKEAHCKEVKYVLYMRGDKIVKKIKCSDCKDKIKNRCCK